MFEKLLSLNEFNLEQFRIDNSALYWNLIIISKISRLPYFHLIPITNCKINNYNELEFNKNLNILFNKNTIEEIKEDNSTKIENNKIILKPQDFRISFFGFEIVKL